jgi:hypothetical protein
MTVGAAFHFRLSTVNSETQSLSFTQSSESDND